MMETGACARDNILKVCTKQAIAANTHLCKAHVFNLGRRMLCLLALSMLSMPGRLRTQIHQRRKG